jgi:RNA polymerase sigma-70 factor (family 1)
MKQPFKDFDYWLAEFRQGNSVAFKYIFDVYNKRLCYYAEQLLNNQQEAEDVVADTFKKLWERSGDFDSKQHITGFLYTTTRNACINQSRSNQRKENIHREFSYLEGDKEDDFLNNMIEGEVLEKIYAAVETLPGKCKQVFKLIYFEGLNTDEVANLMHISERNVLNQKSRAIKLLKARLLLSSILLLYIMQWLFK